MHCNFAGCLSYRFYVFIKRPFNAKLDHTEILYTVSKFLFICVQGRLFACLWHKNDFIAFYIMYRTVSIVSLLFETEKFFVCKEFLRGINCCVA